MLKYILIDNIMKERTENNKLIAEFMGCHLSEKLGGFGHSRKYWFHPNKIEWDHRICEEFELQYHKSWDWLMPVVDEIETMEDFRFDMQIQNDRCTIFDMNVTHPTYDEPQLIINVMLVGEKIIAVYEAVVEFIKMCGDEK